MLRLIISLNISSKSIVWISCELLLSNSAKNFFEEKYIDIFVIIIKLFWNFKISMKEFPRHFLKFILVTATFVKIYSKILRKVICKNLQLYNLSIEWSYTEINTLTAFSRTMFNLQVLFIHCCKICYFEQSTYMMYWFSIR